MQSALRMAVWKSESGQVFQPQYSTVQYSEVAQSCLTLCDPVDCSPPGSSVHGILQASVLEWVAISFSRGSSQPRDRTRVSCIADRCFILWATREVPIPATAKPKAGGGPGINGLVLLETKVGIGCEGTSGSGWWNQRVRVESPRALNAELRCPDSLVGTSEPMKGLQMEGHCQR